MRASIGVSELRRNLSDYLGRVQGGERLAITLRGHLGAELVPPREARCRFDELVAAGVIRPPIESGDPCEGWPDIRLPRGTAKALIDSDR